MSRVLSLHHIIISTHHRRSTITPDFESDLYRVIANYFSKKKYFLHAINGMPEHIHILFDLNPTMSLSDVIGELKRETSLWMKQSGFFPQFDGWCSDFCALGVSLSVKPNVIRYIQSQKTHHQKATFDDEISKIYEVNGFLNHPDELM